MILAAHVLISLVAIATGFFFLAGILEGKDRAVGLFLSTTLATSLSGFLLPFHQLLPSHVIGALSVVLLTLAAWSRGRWRRTYVLSSLTSFYFNLMVLLVQTFKRLPAPTDQAVGPAQLVLLVATLAVMLRADRVYRARTANPY